jgi:hypothetical protein
VEIGEKDYSDDKMWKVVMSIPADAGHQQHQLLVTWMPSTASSAQVRTTAGGCESQSTTQSHCSRPL